MKPFWPIINATLLATFVGIYAMSFVIHRPRSYQQDTFIGNVIGYTATAILLGVVWAICFRPQLERGRLSLTAIFALVTIQAVGLWLVQFLRSLSV